MINVNPHALCLALTRWSAGRSPLPTLSVTCVLAVLAMFALGVARWAMGAAAGVAGNLVFQTRHRPSLGLPHGLRGVLTVDRRLSGRPFRPLCAPLAGFRPLLVSVLAGSNRLRASGAFLALPSPAVGVGRVRAFGLSAMVRHGYRQIRCAATYPVVLRCGSVPNWPGCGSLRAGCGCLKPAVRDVIRYP